MRPGDWPGLAAVILATGVTLTLLGLAAGATWALIHGKPIGEDPARLLFGLMGAVVGALATYLGMAGRRRDD